MIFKKQQKLIIVPKKLILKINLMALENNITIMLYTNNLKKNHGVYQV